MKNMEDQLKIHIVALESEIKDLKDELNVWIDRSTAFELQLRLETALEALEKIRAFDCGYGFHQETVDAALSKIRGDGK
jgi:hypothetical protein